MNTNEIITNEAVAEVTEEIVNNVAGSKLMAGAGVGLLLGVSVGVLTYKYVYKPIRARLKAKKDEVNDLEECNVDKTVVVEY